jgi:hypothetical protein
MRVGEHCRLPGRMAYIAPKTGSEESHVAFKGQQEATMFTKILVLALLLPGVGGCIWPGDGGAVHNERGWGYEEGGDWHDERRVDDEMRDRGHEERRSGHEERGGEERGGGGERNGGHR